MINDTYAHHFWSPSYHSLTLNTFIDYSRIAAIQFFYTVAMPENADPAIFFIDEMTCNFLNLSAIFYIIVYVTIATLDKTPY